MKKIFEIVDKWLSDIEDVLGERTFPKEPTGALDPALKQKEIVKKRRQKAKAARSCREKSRLLKNRRSLRRQAMRKKASYKGRDYMCRVMGLFRGQATGKEFDDPFKTITPQRQDYALFSDVVGDLLYGPGGRYWMYDKKRPRLSRYLDLFWRQQRGFVGIDSDEKKQLSDNVMIHGTMSINDLMAELEKMWTANAKTKKYSVEKVRGLGDKTDPGGSVGVSEDWVEQMAKWKLAQYGNPKKSKPGVKNIVKCPGGNCIGQMLANNHMPFWSVSEFFALKNDARKGKIPISADVIEAVEKVVNNEMGSNKPGMHGMRRMKGGEGRMRSKPRGKKQVKTKEAGGKTYKFAVIHSSALGLDKGGSPWRTVADLAAKGASTHFEIAPDGVIYQYFDPDTTETYHASDENSWGVGIDLTGDPADHTPQQIKQLRNLLKHLGLSKKVLKWGGYISKVAGVLDNDFTAVAHASVQGNRGDPGSRVMNALPNVKKAPNKKVKGKGRKNYVATSNKKSVVKAKVKTTK